MNQETSNTVTNADDKSHGGHRQTGPLPGSHPDVALGKTGVLLVNLGTPDGYDRKSMRRYLREFLSDRRVIEIPRLLWYPILYGIILTFRPSRSGALYKSIWNHERDESPLRTFTRAQSESLAKRLAGHGDVVVDWAMRYGKPSIAERMQALKDQGCDRILVFPLYPQYSAATTASVMDKAFETLSGMRWLPAIRTVPAYHDHPAYIDALAQSLQKQLAELDFEPERIIASYHGVPKAFLDAGDPGHCHCYKTTRLLREKLGWSEDKLITCFQSRFGPAEWLQPYTDKTVEKLAGEGIRKIAIINPGFVSDCLETLEEIDKEVREVFIEAGGESFAHIACLNDSTEGVNVLESIVRQELGGWLKESPET